MKPAGWKLFGREARAVTILSPLDCVPVRWESDLDDSSFGVAVGRIRAMKAPVEQSQIDRGFAVGGTLAPQILPHHRHAKVVELERLS